MVRVTYIYLYCLRKVNSYFDVYHVSLRINPSPLIGVILLPGTPTLKTAVFSQHVSCLREKWYIYHEVFLLLQKGSCYFWNNKPQCNGAKPVH